MTDKLRARPSDQALAVPVEPVSRLAPSGFDPSRMAGYLHDDVIPALEWILDEERIEYDECPSGDYPLCGSGPCNDFGCVVTKLTEAKTLYAIAMEAASVGETEGLDPKDDSAGRRHRTEQGGDA